ncbi:restriction endonuclease subunit S [Lactococcus garvieae]|uniref:restriction endonuclease subunit S n=1 Tax=Lactococcus garvieae TaxID=1363 RepID=UPI0038620C73
MSKKSPQLRFEGFTDDWEERKLKDVVEKQIKGKAQFEKLAPGEVEYLDTSRLNGGQAILTNGLKDVTLDDILILWDGSKAGTVYHGFEGALGSTLKAYRTSANSKFVYQYLKRHQDNIYNNYRTPNIPHVQKDFLNVFTISVPVSDEQEKIGSFFKELDYTITLHQRKLDLLKEQKKGYLQKMFPKNGEKVPELRFEGFADDWEERKLKDVVEKQIKGKAQFEKLAQGDVEYLDTSRLNGGQAILTNGLKDVTLDDILILWDGSKAGTVYHGFEGALGSTLKAYRTSANSKFVYQYLKRHQDNIYNNYRTPNIPHVQKDFLNVFTISVPGSDEQAKIGSFFKKLDDTIALHQRKLDLLKEQKKGFLQKMFV